MWFYKLWVNALLIDKKEIILKKNRLFKSGIILVSSLMVCEGIAISSTQISASADDVTEESTDKSTGEPAISIVDQAEFNKLMLIDDRDDFDYEFAVYLQSKGVDPEEATGFITTRDKRGKATMGAKVAGKAMKAFLKKMGKTWWEKQTKKWYFPVKVNWKTINAIANYSAGFDGTIESAITKYLTSHHIANKSVAKKIAWLIVTIVF